MFDLRHGVLRPGDGVAHRPPVTEYLVIVPARRCLVPEEMYFIEAFLLHKLQTVGLRSNISMTGLV